MRLIFGRWEKGETLDNQHFFVLFLNLSLKAVFFNPLPDDKILDLAKWKKIADDILKYI